MDKTINPNKLIDFYIEIVSQLLANKQNPVMLDSFF